MALTLDSNTTIHLGSVTVQFYAGPTLATVRKASNYKKKKPETWDEEDLYISAGTGERVYVTFFGTAESVEVNDQTFAGQVPGGVDLEDGVNEITVKVGGKSYYIAVHVVRVQKAEEENSGGIVWYGDDDDGFWYFDDAGFFDSVFSLFGATTYDDSDNTIVVEPEGDPLPVVDPPQSDSQPAWPDQPPTPDSTPKAEVLPAPQVESCSTSCCCPSSDSDQTVVLPPSTPDPTPDPTPAYEAPSTPDPTPSSDSGGSSWSSSSDSGGSSYDSSSSSSSYDSSSSSSSWDSGSSSYDSGSSSYDSGSSSGGSDW